MFIKTIAPMPRNSLSAPSALGTRSTALRAARKESLAATSRALRGEPKLRHGHEQPRRARCSVGTILRRINQIKIIFKVNFFWKKRKTRSWDVEIRNQHGRIPLKNHFRKKIVAPQLS